MLPARPAGPVEGLTRAEPVRPTSWCSRRPSLASCTSTLDLSPPPNRPDPSIYSQAPRLAAGTEATWNNPDIALYAEPQHTGASWRMTPEWFLDNLLVTVRNNSPTVAAVNTVVAVSYSQYGIGMPRTPLTTQLVSLAAGEVRQLSIPLPAAVLNQSLKALAVFVDLSHPYDSDLANNQGASSSGISLRSQGGGSVLQIPLGNATADPITYTLSVQPNTVNAVAQPGPVTVAPGATAMGAITHGMLGTGPGNTSITAVARDAQGNLAGGFTWRLYFG